MLNMFRLPVGANSATIAPAVATRPPMPMPVRQRSTPKLTRFCAIAVAPMPMENHAMLNSIIFRRPIRSPKAPVMKAPIMTPTSA